MDEIERLVTKLEGLNGDIAAIKQIVDAQEQAGYITGVTQTADGYQFTMSNGTLINLRDGKDGKDGINGTATITVTSVAAPAVSKSITVTVSDGNITLNTDELVSQGDAE